MRSQSLPRNLAVGISLFGLGFAAFAFAGQKKNVAGNTSPEQMDWSAYGGGPLNDHYSSLLQINRTNVSSLQVVWSFDAGEEGGLQTSPIVVDGVLYGLTPTQKVIALDAATGKLLWKFDSGIVGTQPDRGLAYWSDGKSARILVGVMNFVYALDSVAGKPIAAFGRGGRIDLRENLGREPVEAQSIFLTSPVLVYKDLFIAGGRNPETLPAPPGDIRPLMFERASCAGLFIRFRTRAKLGMKHGPQRHGKPAERQTIGQECRSMQNEELCTSQPAPLHLIFMAPTALETIFLQIP